MSIDPQTLEIIQYIGLGISGGIVNCIHGNVTREEPITLKGLVETAILGGFMAYVLVGLLPIIFPSLKKGTYPLAAISGFIGKPLLTYLNDNIGAIFPWGKFKK